MRLSGVCVYEHEATAYADPESEAQIQQALGRLVKGKTLIVVAHRLSTIRNADQILVVENGRLVGVGRQEELLASCPLYRTMWEQHISAADTSRGAHTEQERAEGRALGAADTSRGERTERNLAEGQALGAAKAAGEEAE